MFAQLDCEFRNSTTNDCLLRLKTWWRLDAGTFNVRHPKRFRKGQLILTPACCNSKMAQKEVQCAERSRCSNCSLISFMPRYRKVDVGCHCNSQLRVLVHQLFLQAVDMPQRYRISFCATTALFRTEGMSFGAGTCTCRPVELFCVFPS